MPHEEDQNRTEASVLDEEAVEVGRVLTQPAVAPSSLPRPWADFVGSQRQPDLTTYPRLHI